MCRPGRPKMSPMKRIRIAIEPKFDGITLDDGFLESSHAIHSTVESAM